VTQPHAEPEPSGPATQDASAAAGAARTASLVSTPFRGGSALGFAILVGLAAYSAVLEGGMENEAGRLLAKPLAVLAMGVFLAIYARRVIVCALQDDRPVPWFKDARDTTTWMQDLGSFAAVTVAALGPLLLLSILLNVSDAPVWAWWAIAGAGLVVATLHLPLALTGSVLKDGALGAGYGGARRAWRADRAAAASVARPTALFLGLFAVSIAVGQWFVKPLRDTRESADHATAREIARMIVFGFRTASVWAAFCMFRRAGLVARDVPAIREALQ
jgi:hypothetical protein